MGGPQSRGRTRLGRKESMQISDWLDKEETKSVDVSQIVLPDDLSYDEVPGETIFFEEINPCGILCTGNHPFSTVERFGHWYYCRGRNKEAGIHSSGREWRFFTKDRDLAVKTAKSHIE
jgi:hypothetical protein